MRIIILYIFLTSTLLSCCISENKCFTQPIESSKKTSELTDNIIVKHSPFNTKSTFGPVLTLEKVKSDSRCPTNVTCKWGGNAEVILKVKHTNKKDTTFTLNTNQKFESEIEIYGYIYKLIELTPYPQNHIGSILQSSYKAQILIEKRK